MNMMSLSRLWSILLRAAKVFFGAWAFAVAGTIIFVVVALITVGPDATESMHYATIVSFLLGLPIMLRWLK
jgi:hypothetical protein